MFKCRLCESNNSLSHNIFELKDCLIDGIYLDHLNDQKIPKSDFTLLKCDVCGLVQLEEIVDHQTIYSNYKFSSTNTKYIVSWMEFLSNILINRFNIKNKKILEIWASDWCFLNLFKNVNSVTWIEPSKILVDVAQKKYNLHLENWFFWNKTYEGNKFDLVICRHVLEHIEQLKEFINNMDNLIDESWMLYIEVPDVDMILDHLNYSNFFHEHINYFSRDVLITYFNSLGYKLLFLMNNEVHNWSFWILLKKNNTINSFTDIQKKIEQDKIQFDSIVTWKEYKKIAWYWAANKTFKLISMFGLEDQLMCLYDLNQSLYNIYIPTKQPIIIKDPQEIVSDKPDCIIIFATSYTNEILNYLRNDLVYTWDIITLFPEVKKI